MIYNEKKLNKNKKNDLTNHSNEVIFHLYIEGDLTKVVCVLGFSIWSTTGPELHIIGAELYHTGLNVFQKTY